MSRPSFKKTECPNCGHQFTIIEFYNEKKIDEKYIRETLTKYKRYETDIEEVLKMICYAEERKEWNLIDLQRILEFIHKTPGGLAKFEKARIVYKDKRIYTEKGKGLNYFLAICKNTKLDKGDIHGSLSRDNNEGTKPAGREF